TLAGCSGGGNDDPKPAATVTATATPTVDQAATREQCVDAWADLIQQDANVSVDDEPSACAGLPADDQLDRYMDGMVERNKRARKAMGG
ncbi:hypothetical protein ACFVWP_46855, partial [Streptomyces sp. NPDC058175]|uniref:hypothetical protein n=1 Tax=Streptomyces sp. NPDC058175 TaxID=3346367 RepID=UPI0036E829CF